MVAHKLVLLLPVELSVGKTTRVLLSFAITVGNEEMDSGFVPVSRAERIERRNMTRNQQIGAWLLGALLLAIAFYRWFNLPQ